MRRYPWKMTAGSKFIDSGTIEATSEGEALNLVLIEQAGKHDADTSYNVQVGGSSASSYGDEFLDTAGASSMDDTNLTPSGHAFAPKLEDVGIEPKDEMAEAVAKGMVKGAVEAIAKKLMEDIVSAQPVDTGCGKTFEECLHQYDNAENFGGVGSSPCPHVFKDTPCGYDAAPKPTRISARQPNLGQVPKYPKGTRCKAGDHDWLERSEIGYGGPVERVCRDCGKSEDLRRAPYATGGLVQPSADVFGAGPTSESRMPIGLTPPEPCGYDLASGPDQMVQRVWINDEEIFPLEQSDEQKQIGAEVERLRNKLERSMGIPLRPESIICECKSMIAVGHLPAGDTSGVACPGCDATYTVRREF